MEEEAQSDLKDLYQQRVNIRREEPAKEAAIHPLLNPESRHYEMIDGVETITRMEQMYSGEELMAWAAISAMKYRLRIGKKDDVMKEARKIESYEAYYRYLCAE